MSDRVAPYSAEAEQAVLSALLQGGGDVADEAFAALEPEEFYPEANRLLFRHMRRMHSAGDTIDPITVKDALQRAGDLERIGLDYLANLLDFVPTAANFGYHAAIVRDRALERRVLVASSEIAELAAQRTHRGEELAAQVEAVLLKATDRASVRDPERLNDVLARATDAIEQRHGQPTTLLGVGTGLYELDEATAGWQPGQYVLLAARPSEGKSALALHLAAHAAIDEHVPTLLFSLEMGADQLAVRLLAAEACLNSRDLERARIRNSDWRLVAEAAARLNPAPLFLDDAPSRSIASVRALARRKHRRDGVRLVVVDYVQLLRSDEPEENRQQEMRMVSAGLKALARDLEVPVLVCAQLNRQVEARGNGRPRLADLRESGALEQDADVVVMLWNNPEKQSKVEGVLAPLTLCIEKQRNGPKAEIDVYYDRRSGRIDNLVETCRGGSGVTVNP